MFKHSVTVGLNYVQHGVDDFELWSKLMVHDLGPAIKPYLEELKENSQKMVVAAHKKKSLKKNCWEQECCGNLKACEAQKKIGCCPVFYETRLDGVHGGMNGGRSCWAVPGTVCEGKAQDHFLHKLRICESCSFYKAVREEEGEDLLSLDCLMKFVERRNHKRFLVNDNAVVIFRPDFILPCHIYDISADGLSFYYVDGETLPKENFYLAILSKDSHFFMEKVPFRIIDDVASKSEIVRSRARLRRCGVRFGQLLHAQTTRLEYFIKQYTTGGSKINFPEYGGRKTVPQIFLDRGI